MKAPERGWLADAVSESLRLPGSDEREQIQALLRRARRVRLSPALTRGVADTVRLALPSVERNVSAIDSLLGGRSIWIEWLHADRMRSYGGEVDLARADAHAIGRVGCLAACDPRDPALVAVFVAWEQGKDGVRHSYAMLRWSLHDFRAAAASAPLRDDAGSGLRLMALGGATIPPGLMGELEIWQGGKAANDPALDHAIARTERDALGEHLFLLAALMLVESGACELVAVRDGAEAVGLAQFWDASLRPTGRPGLARRILSLGARWNPRLGLEAGFHRPPLGGPLEWTPPDVLAVSAVDDAPAMGISESGGEIAGSSRAPAPEPVAPVASEAPEEWKPRPASPMAMAAPRFIAGTPPPEDEDDAD